MSRNRRDRFYNNGGVSGTYAGRMAFREVTLKWKRYALLLVLFFAFVYIMITGAISMYYAGLIIRPEQTSVVPINKNIQYPYTSVSFRSRDLAFLMQGWHFKPKKTENALIIVHGFGENRFPFGEDTLDLVDAIIETGFNVLVFDLRNSGGGVSGISTFGLHEKNDVLGAVDFMRNAGYENIAILGISTGANAAAIAGGAASVEEVGALILDSPIVDTGSFVMHLALRKNPELPEFPFSFEIPLLTGLYLNANVRDADAAPNLAKFSPRHVQLIHGYNDEIVSLSDITSLYDGYMSRAVGKISIWNVPVAGHGESFYIAKDEYIERVTAFLKRVFL